MAETSGWVSPLKHSASSRSLPPTPTTPPTSERTCTRISALPAAGNSLCCLPSASFSCLSYFRLQVLQISWKFSPKKQGCRASHGNHGENPDLWLHLLGAEQYHATTDMKLGDLTTATWIVDLCCKTSTFPKPSLEEQSMQLRGSEHCMEYQQLQQDEGTGIASWGYRNGLGRDQESRCNSMNRAVVQGLQNLQLSETL